MKFPTGQRKAIGYLRCDVSGRRQSWDEEQIRSAARAHGCALAKTIVFSAQTLDPDQRIANVAKNSDAEVVIVPSTAHFDSTATIPPALAALVDVVTVSPDYVHERRPIPAGDPA